MEWVMFALSALCMAIGLFVFAVGVFGIFKFRFVLNRMHSAALLDTMGLFFILLSVAFARGFDAVTVKGLLILVFLWMTSPISSHLIAKMEFFTDKNLRNEIKSDLDEVKGGDDGESSDL